MTSIDSFDPFDRRIRDAIEEIAAARRPDYVDDVLQLTAGSRQRPRWSFPERWLPVNRLSYAAVALAIVVLAGGAVILTGFHVAPNVAAPTSPGTSPAITPSPSPVASPSSSPTTSPTATAAMAGIPVSDGMTLEAGTTYTVPGFVPTLTFVGQANWGVFAFDSTELTVTVPDAGINGQLTILRPGQVLGPGGASAVAAALPADPVAWLRSRPDIRIDSVADTTVGGLKGTLLKGSIVPGAVNPDPGGLGLACETGIPACTPRAIRSLLYVWGGFDIVVLPNNGHLIMIAASALPSAWPTAQPQLEAFLKGVLFDAGPGG